MSETTSGGDPPHTTTIEITGNGQVNAAFEDTEDPPRTPPPPRETSHMNGENKANGETKQNGVELRTPESEESKASQVAEAVNLELVNLQPYSNSIPIKKESTELDIGDPYDEYFVPVNQHKKYMRGEKLYVTQDKRRTLGGSKKKCCWGILTVIVLGAILAILIGVILTANEAPALEESRTFNGNRASVGAGFVPTPPPASTQTPPRPTTDMSEMFLSHVLQGELTIDNMEFTPGLAIKNSSEFKNLAASLEEELKSALFDHQTLHYGASDITLKATEFKPGSVIVTYRIGWEFKHGIQNPPDPIDKENLKIRLKDYLRAHDGFLYNYRLPIHSLKTQLVLNVCLIDNGGCSHMCYFNSTSLQFSCSCQDLYILDQDGKTCMRTGSTEASEAESDEPESNDDDTEDFFEHDHGFDTSSDSEHESSPEIQQPFPGPQPSPEPQPEPTPRPKPEPTSESKPEPSPEPQPEPAPEPNHEPSPEPEPQPASKLKPEPTPEQKLEPVSEQQSEPSPGPNPQLTPEKQPESISELEPSKKIIGIITESPSNFETSYDPQGFEEHLHPEENVENSTPFPRLSIHPETIYHHIDPTEHSVQEMSESPNSSTELESSNNLSLHNHSLIVPSEKSSNKSKEEFIISQITTTPETVYSSISNLEFSPYISFEHNISPETTTHRTNNSDEVQQNSSRSASNESNMDIFATEFPLTFESKSPKDDQHEHYVNSYSETSEPQMEPSSISNMSSEMIKVKQRESDKSLDLSKSSHEVKITPESEIILNKSVMEKSKELPDTLNVTEAPGEDSNQTAFFENDSQSSSKPLNTSLGTSRKDNSEFPSLLEFLQKTNHSQTIESMKKIQEMTTVSSNSYNTVQTKLTEIPISGNEMLTSTNNNPEPVTNIYSSHHTAESDHSLSSESVETSDLSTFPSWELHVTEARRFDEDDSSTIHSEVNVTEQHEIPDSLSSFAVHKSNETLSINKELSELSTFTTPRTTETDTVLPHLINDAGNSHLNTSQRTTTENSISKTSSEIKLDLNKDSSKHNMYDIDKKVLNLTTFVNGADETIVPSETNSSQVKENTQMNLDHQTLLPPHVLKIVNETASSTEIPSTSLPGTMIPQTQLPVLAGPFSVDSILLPASEVQGKENEPGFSQVIEHPHSISEESSHEENDEKQWSESKNDDLNSLDDDYNEEENHKYFKEKNTNNKEKHYRNYKIEEIGSPHDNDAVEQNHSHRIEEVPYTNITGINSDNNSSSLLVNTQESDSKDRATTTQTYLKISFDSSSMNPLMETENKSLDSEGKTITSGTIFKPPTTDDSTTSVSTINESKPTVMNNNEITTVSLKMNSDDSVTESSFEKSTDLGVQIFVTPVHDIKIDANEEKSEKSSGNEKLLSFPWEYSSDRIDTSTLVTTDSKIETKIPNSDIKSSGEPNKNEAFSNSADSQKESPMDKTETIASMEENLPMGSNITASFHNTLQNRNNTTEPFQNLTEMERAEMEIENKSVNINEKKSADSKTEEDKTIPDLITTITTDFENEDISTPRINETVLLYPYLNISAERLNISSKCASGQFACVDGSGCLSSIQRCDAIKDCNDGSDEMHCEEEGCPGNFQCQGGQCLKRHLVCNSKKDCPDGSDELDCDKWQCKFDEFRCSTGECIPILWKCDGKSDCPQNTDEHNCKESCNNDEFLCPEGWCISLSQKCDGVRQCANGEDELECGL